ncbi:MAG TPA: hypothetical protein PK006_06030 [Saprospiraceae bacterium]|nr:hypothetical protein [Saprospiraceae bacterium]
MNRKYKEFYESKSNEFSVGAAKKVEKKIKGNLSFFGLLGNLIELFLPKHSATYMQMLNNQSAGQVEDRNSDAPLNKYPK